MLYDLEKWDVGTGLMERLKDVIIDFKQLHVQRMNDWIDHEDVDVLKKWNVRIFMGGDDQI